MILKTGNVLNIAKSKYTRGRLISLIYKMLLIISGALFPTLIFIQSFGIKVHYTTLIITAIMGSVLFAVIIGGKRPRYIFLIIVTILSVIWAIYYRSSLQTGIISIANIILKNYNSYFDKNITLFNVAKENIKTCHTMCICAVIFELTFVLVAGSWYRLRVWLHMLITGVFVGSALMLGHMPSAVLCMMLLSYLFAVVIAGGIHKKSKRIIKAKNVLAVNDSINARAGIIMIAIVICVNLVLMCIISPVGYDRNNEINKLNKFVDKKLEEIKTLDWFDGNWFSGNKSSGGISNGRLGQTSTLKYTGESAMKVTVPKNGGGYYLRGFVGAQYLGNRWEGLKGAGVTYYNNYLNDGTSWLSYTYNNLLGEAYANQEFASIYERRLNSKMIIEVTGANPNYFYSPYFSKLSEYDTEYDMRVSMGMDEVREITFADYVLDEEYQYPYLGYSYDEAELYEHFVYGYYQTNWEDEVSQDIIDEFDPISGRAGLSEFDGYNYAQCIGEVKDYLEENMEYTLSPGKLKEGQDFLDEFVFVKKKGYCSYFATAATIMFRAQGIPARYVEGYIITEEDYKKNVIKSEKIDQIVSMQGYGEPVDYVQLDIKDYRAHAWTEIYVSGFGWVPIEVTTGYSNVLQGEQPTTKSQEQTTTKSQEQTTTKPQEKQTTTAGASTNKTIKEEVDYTVVFKVILIMIIIVLFIFALAYIIRLRYSKTSEALNHKDSRKAIHEAIKYISKLNSLVGISFANDSLTDDKALIMSEKLGGDMDRYVTLLKIYDKIEYSPKGTEFSEEERNFVISMLDDSVKRVNEVVSPRKKLQIKYIYGLKEKNSL